MAKKDFGVDLDLHGNQLLQARYQNSPTAPTAPQEGQVYFNTADNIFYGWDGISWIVLSNIAVPNDYLRFTQSVPNNVWTIAHNLGFYPNVSVVDSSGNSVEGDIKYLDLNTVQISFIGGFAGDAYLS
jgi:hypothetical protein